MVDIGCITQGSKFNDDVLDGQGKEEGRADFNRDKLFVKGNL